MDRWRSSERKGRLGREKPDERTEGEMGKARVEQEPGEVKRFLLGKCGRLLAV
jgi:hypothetical protein